MRPTFSTLARQYWSYGRGRARTVRKHRLRPRLRQMVPAINLVGLVAALIVAPIWPWALIWPLSYLAALGLVSLAGVRALGRVQGLWAGPALLSMHNPWAAGFLWQMVRGAGR